MQKLLIVVGPTASGKSALAVELARRFDGEIISADSRQVYRGLDIGTGKITTREMRGVPHHLLDIASPARTFTAHAYAVQARRAIDDVASRGKLPIVVGGTGFYIDALLGETQLPDVPPNAALRSTFENMPTEALFAILEKRDPKRAKTIDRRNKRRLVRALEIVEALGAVPAARPPNPRFDTLWIGIALQKDTLEKRIHTRLKKRLRAGMLAEARTLHENRLSYARMESLGLEYRYLARQLRGKLSRAEMEAQLAREIARYAKRQRTYWRRNARIHWQERPSAAKAAKLVEKWLATA